MDIYFVFFFKTNIVEEARNIFIEKGGIHTSTSKYFPGEGYALDKALIAQGG